MSVIFDDAVKNLTPLAEAYGEIMGDIAETAARLREKFLEDGTIVTVPVLDNTETGTVSLCAIDGASGSEKMQSADILVAGATFHEGLESKPIFGQSDSDRKPHFSYFDVRIHASRNDQILGAMRAFTEIAVLGETEHNIAIIDGAYLGNFLTVIYQLQDSEYTAEKIIEHLHKDENKSFTKGVRKILDVKKQLQSGQDVIALAKSDSSREMVKRYVGKSDFFATDKMLAEYLLKPGELILPAPVRANKDKVSILEKTSDRGYWSGFKWDPKKLPTDDYKILEELFDGIGEEEDLFSLYTYLYDFNTYHYTYFKPSKFREGSNPLRMEFISMREESSRDEKALFLASHVNADIMNPAFKEPYSQYMVDRDVKMPVSNALKWYQAQLGRKVAGMGLHVEGLTSGYRT